MIETYSVLDLPVALLCLAFMLIGLTDKTTWMFWTGCISFWAYIFITL